MSNFAAAVSGARRRLLVCILTAALSSCAGDADIEEPAARIELPPVFLIVVDCLRADHLGVYGYPRPTSPFIDQLATDSVVFEHAIAQSNWTKPSMASLLTGTRVSQHGLREGRLGGGVAVDADEVEGHMLSQSLTTWAEAMSALGYATAGFVNQGHLTDYMGFAQGFSTYEYGLHDPQVESRFAAWLEGLDGSVPFAYLHLLDLHFPYTPPEHVDRFADSDDRPIRALMRSNAGAIRDLVVDRDPTPAEVADLNALYDAEVVVVDDRVGRILGILRDQQLYEDSIIVVTSDHGEMLFEHRAFEHGGELLYEPVLHIPWVLRLPGGEMGGRRVAGTVQLADIFPTVLARAGGVAPEGIAGRDVLSPNAEQEPAWPVLAEVSALEGPVALYVDGLKFVFRPDADPSVYDPTADPGETTELVDRIPPSQLFAAGELLREILARDRDFEAQLDQSLATLAPEQIEKLRALGYIR